MLHDPQVEVTCDGENCSVNDFVGLTATARGYDERDIDDDLEDKGWVTIGDNRHLCEDCAEAREEEKPRKQRARK